jgi:hypothetical protein
MVVEAVPPALDAPSDHAQGEQVRLMAIELMDVVDEKEIGELPPSAVSDIRIPLER